jgi:ribosomal protein S18 acetylase RimI-like enzyme
MLIRKATIEDLKAIAEVEAKCFPPAEAASEEDIKSRLMVYPNYFWLLEDSGKLIGFVDGMATNEEELSDEMYADASMHDENGKWQMIFGIDTIPEYRKQGCAEKILKQVIADSKEQGRLGLVLTCKDHLVHYYAKFGFKDEGVSESTHGGVVWHKMRLTF